MKKYHTRSMLTGDAFKNLPQILYVTHEDNGFTIYADDAFKVLIKRI